MKKILATFALVAGLLVLVGCGEPPPQELKITDADREASKNVKGGGRAAPMPTEGIDN